jgi:DNA adenine methylase
VCRYYFVEGLARNWEGVEMQWHTKTKKFKSYPTPFNTRQGAYSALDALFQRHSSILLIKGRVKPRLLRLGIEAASLRC